MNSSKFCSLLLILCLILISYSPLEANAKKGRGGRIGGRGVNIGLICNKASDKVNCFNVLKSDPRFLTSRNYVQLAKVFLEMAVNRATQGQNFLKGLASKNPVFKQCATFDYDGVVGSFRSALGGLTEDPQTANYDAKVAGDGSSTCERGLASARVFNREVASLNRQISGISEIAFLITDQFG